MNKHIAQAFLRLAIPAALFLVLTAAGAGAAIDGVSGPTFHLSVSTGTLSTPDGGSFLLWGYANDGGLAQYPGPTLIVNQGDTVRITLTNNLTVAGGGPAPNVSMVFPGHRVFADPADPGVKGAITNEAIPGGTVTYEFTATHPGTYSYYSGTDTALQVEMGLLGALIVRPEAGAGYAYNHPDTRFDREYLFLLSEMDPRIHQVVEMQGPAGLAATNYLADYFPVLWFLNGRSMPDNMMEPGIPLLPHQPYNSFPRMHPGEKLLMRVVGASRDSHPFHHHGNHAMVIARDGRMLESAPGAGPDLSFQTFTIQSTPGSTFDGIFTWSGKGLNWDVYGTPDAGTQYFHNCVDGDGDDFDDTTSEYCPDHYAPCTDADFDQRDDETGERCKNGYTKTIPVILPNQADLVFGAWYSGSPYLGTLGSLPPGEGGLNPNGGFSFMWHSHTEKELTTNDIFPGGMMTMLIIEPHGVDIP
ncbi:MAG: multicopper oxidase domain-containing protein [Desulfobulbaceae bacterium]|nr:multicopper oxidase domain-containing protein [Desulfobulbaceae bacterium]